jgi:hypothetical protein
MNQLIPEVLLALGGAFLLGNLAAYVRLRSAWREAKRAGRSQGAGAARAGGAASGAKARSGKARSGKAQSGRAQGAKDPALPSRTRVLANVIVGLVITVASLAALIARG